jgi:hypothetical protein
VGLSAFSVFRQEATIGLSSNKSKVTNGPSAYAKPFISAAGGALQGAFAQTQPALAAATASLGAALPGAAERAFGSNPGLDAAEGYVTDTLGGKYLDEGNPHLRGMIDQTSADVRSRVASAFTTAGRTGSGANTYALGRALAANETGLRSSAYEAERARMAQAAGMVPGLEAGRNSALGAYLDTVQAATGLPLSVAQQYAGGIGSLMGGYNTSTQTQSQSLGSIMAQLGGSALSGWAAGGFK